jgi:hypothetical protein
MDLTEELLKQIEKEQKENKEKELENQKKLKLKEEKQKIHKQNVKNLQSMFPHFSRDEVISIYLQMNKNFDKTLEYLLNPELVQKEIDERKFQEEKQKKEKLEKEELEKKMKQEEEEKQKNFEKKIDELFNEDLLISKISSLLPGYSNQRIRNVLRIEKGNLQKTIEILMKPLKEIKKVDISEVKFEKDENKEKFQEMLEIDELFQNISISGSKEEFSDDDEEEIESDDIIESNPFIQNIDFEKIIEEEKLKEEKFAKTLIDSKFTEDFILQLLETKEDKEIKIETQNETEINGNKDGNQIIPQKYVLNDLMKRFPHSQGWKFEVVVRDDLLDRFKKKYKKLKCEPIIGYHGTRPQNISSIVNKGLLVPGSKGFEHATDPGFYGRGIYLSPDAGMSISYCRGGGSLIVCAVLMGKAYKCPGIMMGAKLKSGFDSHISPCGSELILFDAAQVLPLYVIHFTASVMERNLKGKHYFIDKTKKKKKK